MSFPFPFWPLGLCPPRTRICRAGRGLEAGRWAGGQGLRVGEREGSVKVCFGPSSQPADWVVCQCCRGKVGRETPFGQCPMVCTTPLAPLKWSQEEGTSPGPHEWPRASQTFLDCVPRPSMTYSFALGSVCSPHSSTWLCVLGSDTVGNISGLLFAGKADASS